MAKVLENSFRATTIALMQEWGELAEAVGVDLFEVVQAIRCRPTHANLRQPGLGVGGYCLTKDPLFGAVASQQLFGKDDLAFPVSRQAVEINRAMPIASVDKLEQLVDGGLDGRTVLLMGVSYRPGVADTRDSPSATFARAALQRGARIRCHDPLVAHWRELDLEVETELPQPNGVDAVVFAVANPVYGTLDVGAWLDGSRPAVLDANAVLSREQRAELRAHGCPVACVGRAADL
jgi:nucleotide sugar dehydrogenase